MVRFWKNLSKTINYTERQVSGLPDNILDWIDYARPVVGGKKRDFDLHPFWLDVYQDDFPNIMVVNGRQTFKSTFCTDILAFYATTHPNSEVTYVADNETHLRSVSKQRLRRGTFFQNPNLKGFLLYGKANVHEFYLKNGSVIYLVTDENQYNQVESKSNSVLVLDEAQYQDIQFLPKANQSLAQTKGRMFVLGIGGEAGSAYHMLWNKTDQREWIYDDKYWREKLCFDSNGNITNDPDKLKKILSGKWVPQRPENKEWHGFHMPQTIFPSIPLTKKDAKLKYMTSPTHSIEHKKEEDGYTIYQSHALGEFYKAERRPITPEMVLSCMRPYRYLTLLKPHEVVKLKKTFGNELRILMGVDFGSSIAKSATVISIMLKWRKSDRYQLAWIEERGDENQLDQARYIAELGRKYQVDYGVGDLGYGQIQVKVIQKGGHDSKGTKFEGLGAKYFVGCRTTGDETKPKMEYKKKTDEHGEQVGRLQIDKTTSIQEFIDLVGQHVLHPVYPDSCKGTKLVIPFGKDYETVWLVSDFCSITRKDLEKTHDVQKDDPRQRAKKEFNHPRDSVMSIIYSLTADKYYDEDAYKVY